MIKKGKWGFDVQIKEFDKLKRVFPDLVGRAAVKHYRSGFTGTGGGKTDASIGGWKARKINKGKQRTILVKSADLKRSIQIIKKVIHRSGSFVIVGTKGIIYAAIHNYGLATKYFNMPKREFIGKSKELDKEIGNIIKRYINRIKSKGSGPSI